MLSHRVVLSDLCASAVIYLRTVAHLRTRQVIYRGLNIIRRLANGYPRFSAVNVRGPVEWAGIEPVVPFMPRDWIDSSAISRNNFRFLNQSIDCDCGEHTEWDPRGANRLWRYNLHYFDYLHPADSPGPCNRPRLDARLGRKKPPRRPGCLGPLSNFFAAG